jgi:drug/metabolite transporter (DMT)-like permease
MTPRSAGTDVRRGALLALVTAAVSGVAIYLNAFAVKQVPDPAVYTTLKNGIAALALLGLLAASGGGSVRALRPRQWAGLAVLGLVGGSVPFLLFFTGLAQASAPSAAFIHKTLFVWVALLAVPLLGERLGWAQIGALGALLGAQLLLAPPTGVAWGTGETLIAAATLLWAVEVIVARRLLAGIGSSVAAAGRMGFGLAILVGYLVLTGRLSSIAALDALAWTWIVVTGLLLTAYVATWYAALRLAPASLVTSVLVGGAVVTAGLQALASAQPPALAGLIGYGLMLAAVAGMVAVGVRRGPLAAAPAPARAGMLTR